MNKLKLGFVGLGRAAKHYVSILKGFMQNGEIEISCGVDSNAFVREQWEKELKIKTFKEIDMLSNEDCDLVIVLTPSGNHAKDSKKLLMKNLNVLCEKPIGLNIEKVQEKSET